MSLVPLQFLQCWTPEYRMKGCSLTTRIIPTFLWTSKKRKPSCTSITSNIIPVEVSNRLQIGTQSQTRMVLALILPVRNPFNLSPDTGGGIDRLSTSSMNTSRSFPKTLTCVTLLNAGGTDMGNFPISIGLHAIFFPYQVCCWARTAHC
jgi:hypothetical protein